MIKELNLYVPVKCNVEDSVVKVAQILRDTKNRYIFVVDNEEKPVGLISTVDINNRVVAENKIATELKASDIMTSPVRSVDENEEVKAVYEAMVNGDHYSYPVTREGKLVGIINFDELLRKVAKQ